ncbi:unnamed protein product, partial [Mesorhabditis spiculigera]
MNDFPEWHYPPFATNYGHDACPLPVPCETMQEISLDNDFDSNDVPSLAAGLSGWFSEDPYCYTDKGGVKELDTPASWSTTPPQESGDQKVDTTEKYLYHVGTRKEDSSSGC